MATQAALIADTIVGMKRALRRERNGKLQSGVFNDLVAHVLLATDTGPDDPITQPTNRGNKMRANAKYVREGAMGYINAEDFYREVRGTRSRGSGNPPLCFRGYADSKTDMLCVNANRKSITLAIRVIFYSAIRFGTTPRERSWMRRTKILKPTLRWRRRTRSQELLWKVSGSSFATDGLHCANYFFAALLCPLKHPSELPTHPSLSHAYTSQALEQMTAAVEEKLRQERALLWQARSLHRQFLGDGGWMPCGVFETPEDRWIFEPRIVDDNQSVSMDQQRVSGLGTPASGGVNAAQEIASATASVKGAQQVQNGTSGESQTVDNDVEMAEIPSASMEAQQPEANEEIAQFKSEEKDATVTDLPQHSNSADNTMTEANGEAPPAHQNGGATSGNKPDEVDASKDGEQADTGANEDETQQDAEMHDGSSPEPPRRMTTRAQANATNPQEEGSPTSSADTANSLPTPHPLFLIPDSVRPDRNFGLPATEAEETRRLLWSYVQKQEETVRGFEHMLESLLRACHMKSDVLEWCKAEGHVGEMSDGEDWYDREKLGLAEGEDLKKGTDEDEVEVVDESRTTAKRGRGRRA